MKLLHHYHSTNGVRPSGALLPLLLLCIAVIAFREIKGVLRLDR